MAVPAAPAAAMIVAAATGVEGYVALQVPVDVGPLLPEGQTDEPDDIDRRASGSH